MTYQLIKTKETGIKKPPSKRTQFYISFGLQMYGFIPLYESNNC